MTMLRIRASAAACAAAAAALWLTPAYPHAVCGDRIFPATLAIDDPGVTDELTRADGPVCSLQNSDGVDELDVSGSWTKTISPGMPSSFGRRPDMAAWPWRLRLGRARHRIEMSVHVHSQARVHGLGGFDVSWGGTATGAQAGHRTCIRLCSTSAWASALCQRA